MSKQKNRITIDNKFILTDDQKSLVLSLFQKNSSISIQQLLMHVFPDQKLDGRTMQGKAIRDYMATFNVRPKTTKFEKAKFELDEKQQEFIRENFEYMKIIEIVSVLFPTIARTSTTIQYRGIKAYIDQVLKPTRKQVTGDVSAFDENGFVAPQTITRTFVYINKYTTENFAIHNITATQREGAEALKTFLHSPRFIQTINTYDADDDKEMFFAEFVRACYNKPDLTSDEINLYINLCTDYVSLKNTNRVLQSLNSRLEDINDDPEGKISMTLTESIEKFQSEYNNCLKRQRELISTLNGRRADRIKGAGNSDRSFMSLVEFWREEKNRHRMMELEKRKKELISEEVDRLDSFDSIYAEIWGGLPSSLYK